MSKDRKSPRIITGEAAKKRAVEIGTAIDKALKDENIDRVGFAVFAFDYELGVTYTYRINLRRQFVLDSVRKFIRTEEAAANPRAEA